MYLDVFTADDFAAQAHTDREAWRSVRYAQISTTTGAARRIVTFRVTAPVGGYIVRFDTEIWRGHAADDDATDTINSRADELKAELEALDLRLEPGVWSWPERATIAL